MLTEEALETVVQGPGLARPWHGTLWGTDLRRFQPIATLVVSPLSPGISEANERAAKTA